VSGRGRGREGEERAGGKRSEGKKEPGGRMEHWGMGRKSEREQGGRRTQGGTREPGKRGNETEKGKESIGVTLLSAQAAKLGKNKSE
jgi:hypothetical protein